MSVASRKEFIARVTKSNAIPEKKLTAWLEVVDEEDPKKIATKLVRDKLLTPWQAKFLLSGRSRLSVGNYLLRSRISRDELGDKFEAIHSQLNRKVVIQVFPSSIAKNAGLLKKLLKKLRQITELDHPNLVHIYDVDQESERYFLVTEFVEGKTLDSVSPKDLTDTEIAVIIQGIASGLSYAHQSEILHGNVKAENIIVTPKGKAELQGFPSATLTSEVDGQANNITESSDFSQLAKVGSALLKEMPKTSRSEHYTEIATMMVGLKDDTKRDQSLADLGDWVSDQTDGAAEASDILLQPEEDSFISSVPAAEAGGFDSPMATVPKTTFKKKKAAPTPESETDDRGFLATMWQDKRAAFIACCAALLVSVFGGLGYVLSSSTETSAKNIDDVDRSVAVKLDTNDAPLATSNAAEGALSVDREDKTKQDIVDPEASRKALAEFFAKRDGKKIDADQQQKKPAGKAPDQNDNNQKEGTDSKPTMTETSATVDKDAGQETPAVSADGSDDANVATNVAANANPVTKPNPDANLTVTQPPATAGTVDLTRISGVGDKMQAYLNDGGVRTMEQLATMSQAEVQAALAKGNWKGPSRIQEAADWIAQAKKITGDNSPMKESADPQTPTQATTAQPKKPAEIGNPFKNFVDLVNLPEVTNTSDFKIGNLVIAKNHLLGLELLAEAEIARGKIELNLNRDANDKQLWNVELGVKRSDPIPIAQFQKTPTEMKFRWLAAAAENDDGNYLRNCKLKLSTPKDSVWLGLRSPVLIDDFSFVDDAAAAKAETEIDWLPNPTVLKVELQPFSIPGNENRVGFAPREVTKREPGKIFFREKPKERFYYIDVTADIRKRSRFAAQMMVVLPNGNAQPLRSTATLEEFAGAIGIQKTEALYQFQQSKTATKPKNMNSGEFNRLKREAEKNAELLTEMFDLSKQYVEVGKQLSGQKILLQIYFDMKGHRIVIAESK